MTHTPQDSFEAMLDREILHDDGCVTPSPTGCSCGATLHEMLTEAAKEEA